MKNKNRVFVSILPAMLLAVSCQSANAGTIPAGGSATTIIGPGGQVGQSSPAEPNLNGLEDFTNFEASTIDSTPAIDTPQEGTPNVGQTIFFGNAEYYVGANGSPLSPQGQANFDEAGLSSFNNRAFGVFGEGRSDITFTPGVVDLVTLQVRGTESGTFINPDGPPSGPSGSVGFGEPGDELGNASGLLLIYTDLGLQTEIEIPNDEFATITIDTLDAFQVTVGGDTFTIAGDSITRISLINSLGAPANSAVLLGELTVVTTVPEPTTALLAFGTLSGYLATRRRR